MTGALLPHPALSATIAVVWVLLANEISPGTILLGALIGIAVPKFTSVYWPDRPRVGGLPLIAEYIAIVLYDIVVSNIQVAWLVLFRRGDSLRSRLIVVPLDLHSPEAVTVLAGTITMTPGTLTADFDPDAHALLVHGLDVADEAATVAHVKARYERRLGKIFR